MVLLSGKKLLITGITTDDSIAFHVARVAQDEGAEIVVTNFGRGLRLTERAVQRLSNVPPVLEMDITNEDHVAGVVSDLTSRWGQVDGALHAIAYAPADALGGNFLHTPAESAATAFMTSAFSFKTLAVSMLPLLEEAGGGSLVG
ncbi:MAG: SDR family oxidoreductase, partial [Acidimicrobiia bacterium]